MESDTRRLSRAADRVLRDGLDEVLRVVGVRVRIQEVPEAHQAEDAAGAQRVRGRRLRVVVADHVDADLEVLEQRVIERAEGQPAVGAVHEVIRRDRKSTRLNSSHGYISYAVFCLKKKKQIR